MCEKMEAFESEPKPLNMTGGWDQQVNGRADKAEAERRKRISLAEQQKAHDKEVQRARRLSFWILFGLAFILAGGIAMNYIEGFPFPMAVGLAILGVAAYMFALGWVIGHKAR